MKTSHLGKIAARTDFAAGTVECCYPNPVKANTILELAVFEASEHGAKYVNLGLANKYNSGYMGENMEYKAATIRNMDENDFRANRGDMNLSWLDDGVVKFHAVRTYAHDYVFQAEAPSVSELLLKLAQENVTGTVSVRFCNYPNGTRCHPESVRNFLICL